MSNKKRQHAGKRNWKIGRLVRADPEDQISPMDRRLLADRDYQYARARRSSGWKNSKRRHQWERS